MSRKVEEKKSKRVIFLLSYFDTFLLRAIARRRDAL